MWLTAVAMMASVFGCSSSSVEGLTPLTLVAAEMFVWDDRVAILVFPSAVFGGFRGKFTVAAERKNKWGRKTSFVWKYIPAKVRQ